MKDKTSKIFLYIIVIQIYVLILNASILKYIIFEHSNENALFGFSPLYYFMYDFTYSIRKANNKSDKKY